MELSNFWQKDMMGRWGITLASSIVPSFLISNFLSFCGTAYRSGKGKGPVRGDGDHRKAKVISYGY